MTRSLRHLCMLLVLLLALPAMQARACQTAASGPTAHDLAMPAQTMHHGHHGDAPAAPSPVSAHHDCIGCVAPIDIKAYAPAQLAAMIATRAPTPPGRHFLIGRNDSPELRPPRILA